MELHVVREIQPDSHNSDHHITSEILDKKIYIFLTHTIQVGEKVVFSME